MWWAARTTPRLLSSWERGMKVGGASQSQLHSRDGEFGDPWTDVPSKTQSCNCGAKQVEATARCLSH